MTNHDVLIVGAGHSGAHTAIGLRHRGFNGSLALIGDEPELPYERPPLSKEYLSGEKTFDRILIRPARFWAERNIDLIVGERIVAIDPVAHTVESSDHRTFRYGQLVWAAGGRARRLTIPGGDLAGIHAIRSRADVDDLLRGVHAARNIVIIGGGYIGLEAAAVLAKFGSRIVLVEALDRLLKRVAGDAVSRFFEKEHRDHGVTVLLGTNIKQILGKDGRCTFVETTDGTRLPADLIVVGIGIEPEIAPLLCAGAVGQNGVQVDDLCHTSLPDVWAVGDCALHSNAFARGRLIRVESAQNANDMAGVVAQAITGNPEPYRAIPWFWSHQYDLKLQTMGLSIGHDQVVLRGDPRTRSFSVIYLAEDRIIALDCVNATRDYVQSRQLVLQGASIDQGLLEDQSIPLKSHLQ